MKKTRFTDEQIAFALQQHEAGTSVAEILRSSSGRASARATVVRAWRLRRQSATSPGVRSSWQSMQVSVSSLRGGGSAEAAPGAARASVPTSNSPLPTIDGWIQLLGLIIRSALRRTARF